MKFRIIFTIRSMFLTHYYNNKLCMLLHCGCNPIEAEKQLEKTFMGGTQTAKFINVSCYNIIIR